MPKTLRGKLVVSYLTVIAVCLALAGSLGIYWVQRYERDAALTQARQAAQALDHILQALPQGQDRKPDVLLSYLRSEAFSTDAELLFLDRDGVVLHSEPEGALEGVGAPLPSASSLHSSNKVPLRHWTLADKSSYYVLYASLPPLSDTTTTPAQGGVRYVALAVPARDVESPWKEWIPPLVGIGAIAIVFSALISYLLFGSITRPLDDMTQAAEEIAGGQYGRHILGPSHDEVGRLAVAFNHMAHEVERAQRAQRDFMVNISHDLQTPLTSIRGFSQAIVDGAIRDVDGLRRAGKIISDESSRMAEILGALQDLSRLEAGQLEMAKIPVDLAYILRGCVNRFAAQAWERGLSLTLSLPESLPTIVGDSERLAQAFANLLDNALKFTPADGQVSVEGYVLGGPGDYRKATDGLAGDLASLRNGQWVVISIADTGIGIPQDELPRIFERFYQGDKSRTGKEGAGLGLSIAHEIVQAHGGRISVSSEAGKGSQFRVALPVPPTQ